MLLFGLSQFAGMSEPLQICTPTEESIGTAACVFTMLRATRVASVVGVNEQSPYSLAILFGCQARPNPSFEPTRNGSSLQAPISFWAFHAQPPLAAKL
jgi:hypothetical protein